MQNRVRELLKDEQLHSFPLISTFHSLCVRILRQDIDKLEEGYKKTFTIYDTDDSQKVIKACIKDLGMDEKQVVPRVVRSAIWRRKTAARTSNFLLLRSSIPTKSERPRPKSTRCIRSGFDRRTLLILTTF